MMKRALPTIILAAMLAGCSNEIGTESTATPNQGGERITVTATQGMADTRLAYTDGDPTATGESIDVLWDGDDAFTMFSSLGGTEEAHTFTIDPTDGPGQKTAKFTGDILTGADNFKAFHPTTTATKWDDCVFSTTGQKQYGDGSTAPTHLNDYHYMTAVSTTDVRGTDMDFTTHVAVLKFVIKGLPGDKSPSKLTFGTPLNHDLVISKTVGTDGTDGTETPGNELSLELFAAGTADDPADYTAFTAYMAVLPTTIQAGTSALSVTVHTTDGDAYNCFLDVAIDRTFKPGKVYDIELEADDFRGMVLRDNTVASSAGITGTGSSADDPILITNAANMRYFFENFTDNNSSTTGTGLYFKLMTDIEIATTGWPLSTAKDYFKGNLDGNGKAIRGEMISTGASTFMGLFSQLSSGATVSDLTISAIITRTENIDLILQAGGICGINAGTITGCTADKGITFTTTTNNAIVIAGGICGGNTGTISGCRNTGNITLGTHNILNAGGICGNNSGGSVSACSNSGTITMTNVGTDNGDMGGICGQVSQAASVFSGCINTGTVIGTNSGSGYVNAGGISGHMMEGSMYNCTNSSTGLISVIGTGYCGGIAGNWIDTLIPDTSDPNSVIYDCCTSASSQPTDLIGKRESGSADLNTLTPCDASHTHP